MTDTTAKTDAPVPIEPDRAPRTTPTIPTELPASVREKLRPDLAAPRLHALKIKAADFATRIDARNKLASAAQMGANSLQHLKALRAPAVEKLKNLTHSDGFAARTLRKSRDVGVGVGTALDKLKRETPKPKQQTRKPEASQIVREDVTTEVLERRANERTKRPAIFGINNLLTAAVTGGLIHIGTTFAIPMLGTGSAFRQLRTLPVNSLVVMPQQGPGAQILPFIPPDVLYAICRYDVSSSPLVIQARLPEIGWSLALYTPHGDNYYAVPGQPQGPVDVSFVLAPATDRVLNLSLNSRRPDLKMNQVTAPQREGLLVIRAPIKGVSFLETLKDELKSASCTPQQR